MRSLNKGVGKGFGMGLASEDARTAYN